MSKSRLTLGVILLSLVACLGVTLRPITPDHVKWASTQWADMDQKTLEDARTLYVNRCSGCHNLYLPGKLTLEKWDVMLSSMAPRAKLTLDQRELIWRYIVTEKAVPESKP